MKKSEKMQAKSHSSVLLTEEELRSHVENFYSQLPSEYIDSTNKCSELRLIDNRPFTEFKQRYLDAALISTSNNKKETIVIEFKRSIITTEIIKDCGWYRGYLELCLAQVPNFKWFVFVGQSVNKDAVKICKTISDKNDEGIRLEAITYEKFIASVFNSYLLSESERKTKKSELFKIACSCQEVIPFWLGDNWLDEMGTKIFNPAT